MYHAVYDATPGCGALTTALTCSDLELCATGGLIIGNTYIVQVYSWTATPNQTSVFDICIGTSPEAPENDLCDEPQILLLLSNDRCNNLVSGTNSSAIASTSGTCLTAHKDVWYSFTAAEDAVHVFNVTETFDSGFFTTFLTLFTGENCGALTQFAGTYCFTGGPQNFALVNGTTYFVNVRSTSASAFVNFDLCVFLAPPLLVNDACVGAIAIREDILYQKIVHLQQM